MEGCNLDRREACGNFPVQHGNRLSCSLNREGANV
jgi:hypothetical protein